MQIPLSATEYSSVSYVLNTAMITSVTLYHWRRSSSLLYLPTTIVINTLSIKTISSEFYPVSLALTTILLSLVTSAITIFSNTPNTAYAHIYNNITQEWKDRQNNIKIQFSYLPEHPTMEDLIQLRFSIQNLQTGNHLKNLVAKITLINTDYDATYKLRNITVTDGDFSIKSPTLDPGVHRVIIKINSKDYSSLASFNMSVLE